MKKLSGYLHKLAYQDRDNRFFIINAMAQDELNEQRRKQMEKILLITHNVAVHCEKMSERQKEKHKEKQMYLNGRSYYIFERITVWCVGIQPDDRLIYD